MSSLTSNLYAFGQFQVDEQNRALHRGGEPIALTPKAFEVLLLLIQHSGEVVSKDELMQTIWGDSFVEESNLTQTVFMLRKALGESASQRYILTVQGKGYRFTSDVKALPANGHTSATLPRAIFDRENSTGSVADVLPPRRRNSARTPIVVGIFTVVVIAAVAWLYSVFSRRGEASFPLHSVAVLPLDNFSGDPAQEFFVDGMTDQLITDLAKVSSLRVISRTSVMRYKGTKKALPEIARELKVDGIIEGSVTRSGGRVRITAQLINASTDKHLWAESYDRDVGDVLKLQSEVAQVIAQQVRVQLTPQEQVRLRSAKPVNPEAYEDYLKGRYYFLNEFTKTESLKLAQNYFEQAIQKDPGFALGYAGLGDTYAWLGLFNAIPPQDAYRSAREAVRKAQELDDSLGETHDTLGVLSWRFDWDWGAAEREFSQSITLAPSYSCAHEDRANYLAFMGRRDEALSEVTKSKEIDPGPGSSMTEIATYYQLRDYKGLIESSEREVISNPGEWTGYQNLAVGYEGSGQLPEAVAAFQKAVEISNGNQDVVAGLAHAYAAMGRTAETRKLLNNLRRQSSTIYMSPYVIATVYAALGDKDKAFEFLDKAYQERSLNLSWHIVADLRIDNLRSDPRFQELLHKMGLKAAVLK
jgi:TolB-like protein/DNA-binding winged helix-turn-helix (wHTH) protein/Flp pilus assembly protein TadD